MGKDYDIALSLIMASLLETLQSYYTRKGPHRSLVRATGAQYDVVKALEQRWWR